MMVSLTFQLGFNSSPLRRVALSFVCCLPLAGACLPASAQGGASYGTKIVARSGQGIEKIDQHVSINDNGYVAFLGTNSNVQNIFTASVQSPGSPLRLMSKDWEFLMSGSAPTQTFGFPQITNSNQVVARRFLTPVVDIIILTFLGFPILQEFNPPITYVEAWDATKTSRSATQIVLGDPNLTYGANAYNTGFTITSGVVWKPDASLAALPSPFVNFFYSNLFFQYLPPFPIWQGIYAPTAANDNGQAVFLTLKEDARDHSHDGNYLATPATDVAHAHKITDDPKLMQPRIANNGSIVFTEGDAVKLANYDLSSIQSVSDGYSNVGTHPTISKDGKMIAFYGEQGDKQGIVVRYSTSTGYQTAFVASNSQSSLLQDSFVGFYPDESLGVSNDGVVVYKALVTNDQNQQVVGIFTTTITPPAPVVVATIGVADATPPEISNPNAVALQGRSLDGTSAPAQDFDLSDPINQHGDVAFWALLVGGSQAAAVTHLPPAIHITKLIAKQFDHDCNFIVRNQGKPILLLMGTDKDNKAKLAVKADVTPFEARANVMIGIRLKGTTKILKSMELDPNPMTDRTIVTFDAVDNPEPAYYPYGINLIEQFRELFRNRDPGWDVNSYEVVAWYKLDDNEPGRYDIRDIFEIPTKDEKTGSPTHTDSIRVVTKSDYASIIIALNRYAAIAGSTYPYGSALLAAFATDPEGNASNSLKALDATFNEEASTITFTELSRPLGAVYGNDCMGPVKTYVWPVGTHLSDTVAADVKSHQGARVVQLLEAQAKEWFAAHPSENLYQSIELPLPLDLLGGAAGTNFNYAFGYLTVFGYGLAPTDLFFAFGNVHMDIRYKGTVKKAFFGGFSVKYTCSGSFANIYQFNPTATPLYLSRLGAELEAGYGTLGTAGHVHRNRVEFTFTGS